MIYSRLLEHLIGRGEAPSWMGDIELSGPFGHAVQRLAAAVKVGVAGLDWAVLVRQCLRRLPSREGVTALSLGDETLSLLQSVGVSRALDGTLSAAPYRPEWVADLGNAALDWSLCQRIERDQTEPGEPWLHRFTGNMNWKSGAQRDASWYALNATPNSTVLVGLPTGSGKSLVYQCCAAFERTGLTVLVVPTVALGIDQLATVRELPIAEGMHPLLYTPDDSLNVLESLRSRKCRLLIASPEAIVEGRLREVLRRHAEDGFLRRLVIDEAHLVESWGADFRIEFQLLGAALQEWREIAPSGVRTLLLSATFSPSTPAMLRGLFASEGGAWEQYIVQRLRPEIHYFAASNWATAEEQLQLVSEAIRHLPRPAILYVTKVSEAKDWGERLRSEGYERLRVFHGDTDSTARKEIMAAWRKDEIDLVVATSAFGMGVDKPDVRSVVHACLPEGIDRFYQEVGRGGRDGDPCISLLIPKVGDEQVARGLGPSLLSDPVKVNGRWREIWHSREPILVDDGSSGAYRVRTDVKPEYLFSTESFGENTRWNKRLLLMMDRAGLIRIESLRKERSAESGTFVEFAVIRPLRSTISLDTELSELLDEPRTVEVERINRATDRLVRYFNRIGPACRELRDHYGPDTRRACGSCGFCRTRCERAVIGGALELDKDTTISAPAVQVVQGPGLTHQKARAEVALALRQLLRTQSPLRIVVDPEQRGEVAKLLELADDGLDQPYRIDGLNRTSVASVGSSEVVIVIHMGVIDEEARIYNRSGRWVAHWLLGGAIEHPQGRWPFMHDASSRAYPGDDGLDRWLGDIGRFESLANPSHMRTHVHR